MKLVKNVCLTALLTLGATTAMAADCTYPKKPANPPEGKTATQDEMVAAMRATRQYDADVKTYQACLNTETETMIAALGDKATPEEIEKIKSRQDTRANAAYEEATKVAEAFNVQLRAFKAK